MEGGNEISLWANLEKVGQASESSKKSAELKFADIFLKKKNSVKIRKAEAFECLACLDVCVDPLNVLIDSKLIHLAHVSLHLCPYQTLGSDILTSYKWFS